MPSGNKDNQEININLNLNDIVDKIGSIIGKLLYKTNFTIKNVSGGIFVSAMTGDYVVAAFYHPSKRHSATADGGALGGGQAKSISNPKKWAIAYSSQGVGGRRTYYNTL